MDTHHTYSRDTHDRNNTNMDTYSACYVEISPCLAAQLARYGAYNSDSTSKPRNKFAVSAHETPSESTRALYEELVEAMLQQISPHDPSKMKGEACYKVMNTTELLENILLEGPLFNLFVQQRTCKKFRDTIEGSTKLQEHMFLKPIVYKGEAERPERRFNPLLQSSSFQPSLTTEYPFKNFPDALAVGPIKSPRCMDISYYSSLEPYITDPSYPHVYHDPPKNRVLPPTGSWRRMLVAQPAFDSFSVSLRSKKTLYQQLGDDICVYRHFCQRKWWKEQPEMCTMGNVWEFVDGKYLELFAAMARGDEGWERVEELLREKWEREREGMSLAEREEERWRVDREETKRRLEQVRRRR